MRVVVQPLAVIAAISACGPAASLPDVQTSHSIGPTECREVVLPTGLGLGWTELNHRVSRWGLRLDRDDCLAETLVVDHVGGSYSDGALREDVPMVDFGYQTYATGDGVAARVSVQTTIDRSEKGDRVVFSRDELGFADERHVVAFVEGVRFDTAIEQADDYPTHYDPALGYTTRGFGARVEARTDGPDVELTYSLRFATGGTVDRPFMTAASRRARIGCELDVVLVATTQRPRSFATRVPLVSDVTARSGSEFAVPSGATGMHGITGFEYRFAFGETCRSTDECTMGGQCSTALAECIYPFVGELADYLRHAKFELRRTAIEDGGASFEWSATASNASDVLEYHELRGTFLGEGAWIPSGKTLTEGEVRANFETGRQRFEL